MFKKLNKKGFTLAELLVVVAIIGVLVAISIPIFTRQLEKAKEATDLANVRAAYAEVVSTYLTENKAQTASVDLVSNTSDVVTPADTKVAGVTVDKILQTNPTVIKVTSSGEVTINGQSAQTSIGTITDTK